MVEEWRSIAGFEEEYEVSDTGRVRSIKIGEGLWPEWFKPGHWDEFKSSPRSWLSLSVYYSGNWKHIQNG